MFRARTLPLPAGQIFPVGHKKALLPGKEGFFVPEGFSVFQSIFNFQS